MNNKFPLGDYYPSGSNAVRVDGVKANGYNSYSYGWPISILSQIEQGPLYNAWNFSFTYVDVNGSVNTNSTVSYNQLATLLCPSENSSSRPQPPYAALNYVGNIGGPGAVRIFSGIIVSPQFKTSAITGGIAPTNAIGIESVTDGTTNTAMFSERLLGVTNNTQVLAGDKGNAKRAMFPFTPSTTLNSGNAAGALTDYNTCKALPPTTQSSRSYGNGQIWIIAHPWDTIFNRYNHHGTPNMVSCSQDTGGGSYNKGLGGALGVAPPSSNHPGGVNMCMADGSVRFVKDSVALQTFWALGTRDGGEILSADSY